MRILFFFAIISCCLLTAIACNGTPGGAYTGPKVKSIAGQVLQEGKPIALPENSGVVLQLMFEGDGGQSCDITLSQDGTFTRDGVAAGKYRAFLTTPGKEGSKGKFATRPYKYAIPDQINVEQGKSDYKIEVGKEWKGPS